MGKAFKWRCPACRENAAAEEELIAQELGAFVHRYEYKCLLTKSVRVLCHVNTVLGSDLHITIRKEGPVSGLDT